MDEIKFMPVVGQVVESVGLHKLKRIILLMLNIHADNLVKPGSMIPYARPSRTAIEVKESDFLPPPRWPRASLPQLPSEQGIALGLAARPLE